MFRFYATLLFFSSAFAMGMEDLKAIKPYPNNSAYSKDITYYINTKAAFIKTGLYSEIEPNKHNLKYYKEIVRQTITAEDMLIINQHLNALKANYSSAIVPYNSNQTTNINYSQKTLPLAIVPYVQPTNAQSTVLSVNNKNQTHIKKDDCCCIIL